MIVEPVYFHKDFQYDFPKANTSQLIRIAKIALPFLSLYQPFARVIALGTSSIRLVSSGVELYDAIKSGNKGEIAKGAFNTVMAFTAVATSIQFHPLGMLITTIHDMSLNVFGIYDAVMRKDYLETARLVAQLAGNALYAVAMLHISVELSVALLAVQVVVCAVSSIHEFKQENYPEFVANIAMGIIRTTQLVPEVKMLKHKWEIERAIKHVFVGKLGQKWQFPSDHLPTGVEVDGVKFVSWNVLNSEYMDWYKPEKDGQGLGGSMITAMDKQIDKTGLTQREQHVINLLGSMMKSQKQVIALQECGDPFLRKLQTQLPKNWKMIRTTPKPVRDQEVILYDSKALTHSRTDVTYNSFASAPGRVLQSALFERANGKSIRIYNVHIPGDPKLSARNDLANYVQKNSSSKEITMVLGDNNFEPNQMFNAYYEAGLRNFKLRSYNYNTNIDPVTQKTKSIDLAYVNGAESRTLKPEEVMNSGGLKETIQLLHTPVA